MPICTKCRQGFDSELRFCPNCGTAYSAASNNQNEYARINWFWVVQGVLLLLGCVASLVMHSIDPLILWLYLSLLISYIWSIFWAYGDAEVRGKPGCAVALLVAVLSWPIGLLIWVVFRP